MIWKNLDTVNQSVVATTEDSALPTSPLLRAGLTHSPRQEITIRIPTNLGKNETTTVVS